MIIQLKIVKNNRLIFNHIVIKIEINLIFPKNW